MKISSYKIEFRCPKCGSSAAMSGDKVYKDLSSVLAQTDDAKTCYVCGGKSITFSHLHAVLLDEDEEPKVKYELGYKCEKCGSTFKSAYWIKRGDPAPFSDPKKAGITCLNRDCNSKQLYLVSCKYITG